MARRILHKLKLTEISGVDRPCQEGARVTIMKRNVDPVLALQDRVEKLKDSVDQVDKAWSAEARRKAVEARRNRQKKGQPKYRGLKATAIAASGLGIPAAAAYLYATRNSKYE
jgi:uncharacterized Ntn-hydrolase superfamily protein